MLSKQSFLHVVAAVEKRCYKYPVSACCSVGLSRVAFLLTGILAGRCPFLRVPVQERITLLEFHPAVYKL